MKLQYPYRHDVLRSEENNLIYIPILKNAHTWAENILSVNFGCNILDYRSNGGLAKKFEPYLSKQKGSVTFDNSVFIIIIREPTSRWVSAMTQYLGATNINLDDPAQYELIREGIIFDNHARPQYVDLLDINLFNAVIFECNDNLQENLNNFSEFWFDKKLEYVPPMQKYTEHENKKMLYEKLESMVIKDDKLKKRLEFVYDSDYNLYNTLKKMNLFVTDKIPDHVCALRQNNKYFVSNVLP